MARRPGRSHHADRGPVHQPAVHGGDSARRHRAVRRQFAKLGDLRTVGRLVVRTLAFFWATMLAGIALGFLVATVMLPSGAGLLEQQLVQRPEDPSNAGIM